MKYLLLVFGITTAVTAFSQEIKMSEENTLNKEEISAAEDQLDLAVVAEIFGESSDLEDFEKRLNDPDAEISNLDLNADGEADYLRASEKEEGDTRTIYVQAAVSEDDFKNVASLIVVKDENNEVNVKVEGDEKIYGKDYVIVPVYRTIPPVVTWFWGPTYRVWRSPYRFGYYPPYYRSRVVVTTRPAAVRRKTIVRTTRPASRRTVIIRN